MTKLDLKDVDLNDLRDDIHFRSASAGWWDDCHEWVVMPSMRRKAMDMPFLATKIALIHSEASEMLEGLRKGLPDDHLPHRSMEEVECADLLIRIFDYAGARDLDIMAAVAEKLEYNAKRADHKKAAREAEGGKKF